jgi:osmotically-inducible protein OsmY
MMADLESELAVTLREKLMRDRHTTDSQIEVIDNGGVITLSGTAVSNKARAAAAQIVLNHPGVLSLINDIEVNDPDATSEVIVVAPLATDPAFRNQ